MSIHPLASGGHSPEGQHRQQNNPFAKPDANPISSPMPSAQPLDSSQSLQEASARAYTTTANDRVLATTTSNPTSRSSERGSLMMTPLSSVDFEKAKSPNQHNSHVSNTDPEKAIDTFLNKSHERMCPEDSSNVAYLERGDDIDNGRRLQEHKAIKILLFLSGPCAALSSLNMAWCCISLVITLLSQPVRLCARRTTFGQQLSGLLGPTLNLQLRCIYTPLPPYANEDGSYHTLMLVTVHLLSPLLSLGVALVAWVLAAYWMSSVVVGDPAGLDKRDDGRETVLELRGWWERWLMRSVKEDWGT